MANEGAGTVLCAMAAGAASNAVSDLITSAQTGHFSAVGLAQDTVTGAAEGAAFGGVGKLAGTAADLLTPAAEADATAGGGDLPTYHRLESPTQTPEDAAKQVESGEVWGRAPRGSDIPKVQAYSGPLPEGARGIEFTTDVPPDRYGIPGQPTWSGPRPGVSVEDDYAKICVASIWTNQC